jgi:hypothetical protein
MIQTSTFEDEEESQDILHRIRDKLAYFEDELPRLKEVTSILELALWKMRMDEEKSHHDRSTQSQKKIKVDSSSMRRQCRITCGADIVISHMLPFLIITVDDESCSDSESESQ